MTATDPSVPATGPVLPSVRMHLHTPAAPAIGTCVVNERCTSRKSASFVRHIAFDVSGSSLAANFRSGQSFGVIPPGLDAAGRPHKLRLYSIACPTAGEDGQGRIVSTTVKRTIDEHHDTGRLFLGVASNFLCDLKPGDTAQLTGPNGKRFVLPADPSKHDYLFLATGTGIAPFRGMVRELAAAGCTSRIVLVMGSPYATDLLYHDDFLALQSRQPNFRYLTAISREPQADGHGPIYVQDRLSIHREELEPMLAADRTLIYICGVAGMELGIFRSLAGTLPEPVLEQYLKIQPSIRADVKSWQRSMIPREVSPTRRVFVEVYD